MDFGYSQEHTMLKDGARKFFEKQCPPSLVKEMAANAKGYSPEMWKQMADLGWLGLTLGEEYGGSGGSFMDLTILLQEMGRAVVPGPFFSSAVMAGTLIQESGTEENKKKYLPLIASGELIATVAILEESGRYVKEDLKAQAKKAQGDYQLSGIKLFVPDAQVAQKILCAAKAPEGITFFVVDAASKGLSITPLPTLSGERMGEVALNGVTAEAVIGKAGRGWEAMEKVWPNWVIAKCAEMVGGSERALEMTVQYAKERKQFGQPLAAFQAVQHHCVNMAIDLETSRYLMASAAWMLSEGLPCSKEVAMAKACCSDAFKRITFTGHQIHGGIGFTQEHDLHLHYKRAKTSELMFGDADLHREIVAREMTF
jgi:alkylation response protein AidB-like acyl-CoA dehydrogenase